MFMKEAFMPDDPTGRKQHDDRIAALARMHGDRSQSFEDVLDFADIAYMTAHSAGLMRAADGEEEPFVYPSVQRERLYKEQVREDRPTVVASASYQTGVFLFRDAHDTSAVSALEDVASALSGITDKPAGIKEVVNDNDTIQGSHSITWMACDSREEAVAYCQRVGWAHERPGLGEDDGVYTYREVFDNPHYEPAPPQA
jgi:hypothetical protein